MQMGPVEAVEERFRVSGVSFQELQFDLNPPEADKH